jgi:hypothetical protein
MERAASSPLGNMFGATVRAVENFGATGPLRQLYEQLVRGEAPRITPRRWIEIALQSGLDHRTAATLLRQWNLNSTILRSSPVYLRALRSLQYTYDIAPILQRLQQRYKDPELVRGALAEYAARMGYQGVGALSAGDVMMIMHSPLVNAKAKQLLENVMEEADKYLHYAEKGKISPERRIVDVIKGVMEGEKISPTEIARRVLNLGTISEFRKEISPVYSERAALFGWSSETPQPAALFSGSQPLTSNTQTLTTSNEILSRLHSWTQVQVNSDKS